MRRALRRFRHLLWRAAHHLERRYGGGEMQHVEDRASTGEWGPLGSA